MYKLSVYMKFDWEGFASGKDFTVTSCHPWKNEQKNVIGTRIETVITKDTTDYGVEGVSNLFEKVAFKVPALGVTIPIGTIVEPVNPVATVWGDYRNQLSVKADSVKPVGAANGGKS